jgi:hypothetical protein
MNLNTLSIKIRFKIFKNSKYNYENSIYRKHTERQVGKAPKGVFRFKRPDELAANHRIHDECLILIKPVLTTLW